jgi:hypothetical protein
VSCITKAAPLAPCPLPLAPCPLPLARRLRVTRLTLAQHFNNWWILLFGRVTGGVATSLLFSVFEAWMVSCCFPPFLFANVA